MQMCFHVKKVAVSVCETIKREECTTGREKWCEPQLGDGDCVSAGDIPWQELIHTEKTTENIMQNTMMSIMETTTIKIMFQQTSAPQLFRSSTPRDEEVDQMMNLKIIQMMM